LLIFKIDVRPEHLTCRFPVKLPIPFCVVQNIELNGLKRVLNLRGEQVSMLVPNLGRGTLEMNVRPAALLESVGVLEAGIGRSPCLGGTPMDERTDEDREQNHGAAAARDDHETSIQRDAFVGKDVSGFSPDESNPALATRGK
jgi:hypothetical protein